ncbi:hypothetical protein D9Q98_010759, partial (chloroplast) [Chlorella vulgaris]
YNWSYSIMACWNCCWNSCSYFSGCFFLWFLRRSRFIPI